MNMLGRSWQRYEDENSTNAAKIGAVDGVRGVDRARANLLERLMAKLPHTSGLLVPELLFRRMGVTPHGVRSPEGLWWTGGKEGHAQLLSMVDFLRAIPYAKIHEATFQLEKLKRRADFLGRRAAVRVGAIPCGRPLASHMANTVRERGKRLTPFFFKGNQSPLRTGAIAFRS